MSNLLGGRAVNVGQTPTIPVISDLFGNSFAAGLMTIWLYPTNGYTGLSQELNIPFVFSGGCQHAGLRADPGQVLRRPGPDAPLLSRAQRSHQRLVRDDNVVNGIRLGRLRSHVPRHDRSDGCARLDGRALLDGREKTTRSARARDLLASRLRGGVSAREQSDLPDEVHRDWAHHPADGLRPTGALQAAPKHGMACSSFSPSRKETGDGKFTRI